MMHDSGKREDFETGAVRDTADDKPRPDLISPFAEKRLGEWLRLGAGKYEDRNWEKGMPISRCIASLQRHLVDYKMGLNDEDHMAAIMCNAMFIIHYEDAIANSILPANLDDMPKYFQNEFVDTEQLRDLPPPPMKRVEPPTGKWALDASRSNSEEYCFCPVDRQGTILVKGSVMGVRPPGELVTVCHAEGADSLREWVGENQELLQVWGSDFKVDTPMKY